MGKPVRGVAQSLLGGLDVVAEFLCCCEEALVLAVAVEEAVGQAAGTWRIAAVTERRRRGLVVRPRVVYEDPSQVVPFERRRASMCRRMSVAHWIQVLDQRGCPPGWRGGLGGRAGKCRLHSHSSALAALLWWSLDGPSLFGRDATPRARRSRLAVVTSRFVSAGRSGAQRRGRKDPRASSSASSAADVRVANPSARCVTAAVELGVFGVSAEVGGGPRSSGGLLRPAESQR